jgi:hypothetical protein
MFEARRRLRHLCMCEGRRLLTRASRYDSTHALFPVAVSMLLLIRGKQNAAGQEILPPSQVQERAPLGDCAGPQ